MSKKKKKIIFMAAGILILSLGIVRVFSITQSGKPFCERIDSDQCFINVRILNDSSEELSVSKCTSAPDHECKTTDKSHYLQPDDFYNTVVKPGAALPEIWVAKDSQGQTVGCISLKFKKDSSSSVVEPLSRVVSCRKP